MDVHIVSLAGLTVAEVTLLNAEGITDGFMLSVLGYDGLHQILPTSSVIVKKKLETIGMFVAKGNVVDGAVTMEEVVKLLNQAPTNQGSSVSTTKSHATVKVSVNFLKEFSGAPIDWEDWEEKTIATVRQTHFAAVLEGAADTSDPEKVKLNNQFYNVLFTAVREGSAFHLVDGVKEQDGYLAWKALKDWYGSAATSRTIIDHYRKKLESLRLDDATKASEYVNVFIQCCQKLEAKDEGPSKATKMKMFLDKIVDDDYNVVKQNLQHRHDAEFEDCVAAVRAREQIIMQEGSLESGKRARRFINKDKDKEKNHGKSGSIPFVPSWIFKSKDAEKVKSDLLTWRKKFNEEKKHLKEDESEYKKAQGGSSSTSKEGHARKKFKPSEKKKVRRTKTHVSGSPESSIKVSMKDEDNDDDFSADDSDGEDDSVGQEATSRKKSKQTGSAKKKAKKARRFTRTRRGRMDSNKPRVIVDTGTDLEVIGGAGWKVLSRVNNKVAQLDGALAGMIGKPLVLVNAVTAYDHPTKGVILVGVGNAVWDDRAEQTEALLNAHELRKHNVVVNDKARIFGGKQNLEFDEVDIPLDFLDGKTMSFNNRVPKEQELQRYEIHWLTPMIKGPENFSSRRLHGGVQDEEIPWKERLGNCPQEIVDKTLGATTQYCLSLVEMENRNHPRQHRKMRILPLHPRRIQGRTDSDTFFSTVKSIRQFNCVQIFHCVQSGFTYVKGLLKKQQAPTAYEDFIREVGAPNKFLTDNEATLISQKMTTTSRRFAIQQLAITPRNPQQNTAERKLAVVKHRVMVTMRESKVPLVFWCYCMEFIVDCLNHTALKKLGWKTPMEKLFGNTPDISMFRFVFWEKVLYFDPMARFPEASFLPGRFVGIAWNHGDAFTYRIWSEPNGDWTKGRELIRNVVKTRKGEPEEGKDETFEDHLEFSKNQLFWRYAREVRGKKGRVITRKTENLGFAEQIDASDQLIELPEEEEEAGTQEKVSVEDVQAQEDEGAPTTIQPPSLSAGLEFNPADQEGRIEMVAEMNDEYGEDADTNVKSIRKMKWKKGKLWLKVEMSTDEKTWMQFEDLKVDMPILTAKFIEKNHKAEGSVKPCPELVWAQKTLKDFNKSTRRLKRIYGDIEVSEVGG